MEDFTKIFTECRYAKPFITLNVLFLLMSFSGKFAIEMYAVDVLKGVRSSIARRSALILLGEFEAAGSISNSPCNHCRICQLLGFPPVPTTGKTLAKEKYSYHLLTHNGSCLGRSW